MKFSEIEAITAPPLGVRPERAVEMLGSSLILDLMVKARWLKPTVQGNRLTLYDYGDLKVAWSRLTREGLEALKQAAAYAAD